MTGSFSVAPGVDTIQTVFEHTIFLSAYQLPFAQAKSPKKFAPPLTQPRLSFFGRDFLGLPKPRGMVKEGRNRIRGGVSSEKQLTKA